MIIQVSQKSTVKKLEISTQIFLIIIEIRWLGVKSKYVKCWPQPRGEVFWFFFSGNTFSRRKNAPIFTNILLFQKQMLVILSNLSEEFYNQIKSNIFTFKIHRKNVNKQIIFERLTLKVLVWKTKTSKYH